MQSLMRIGLRAALLCAVALSVATIWLQIDSLDSVPRDFVAFWSASYLALAGNAAAAYDVSTMLQTHKIVLPLLEEVGRWRYPPTYQLLTLPIALMPYAVAWFWWNAATLAAYLYTIRRFALSTEVMLAAVAFPAVLENLVLGHNGLLTTALLGGALFTLKDRPYVAGVLLGILTMKPHLGLLVPLALICGRYWTAFLAAAATAIGLAVMSAAVLGPDTWVAFLDNIGSGITSIDNGILPGDRMPTTYVALTRLGLDPNLVAALHIGQALLVAGVIAYVWRSNISMPMKGAVLACGTVMIPPYLFDYDLVVLALPITVMAMEGLRNGWLSGERLILALAWLAPMTGALILPDSAPPLTPPIVAMLFAITVRRALRSQTVTAAVPGTTFAPLR